MLERHVNSHFRDKSNDNSSSGSLIHNPARKSIEGAPAGKLLKRAGVKLKFRALPFSARIFDFFDLGIMAGIRHQVVAMEEKATSKFNIRNDSIQFTSKAISIRKDKDGRREVRLKWIPENLLVDEWVPLHTAQTTKSVKVCNLPEAAKQRLQHELLLKPVEKKQSRKNKRVDQLSPFL
jgi:zinc finger protein AEBP2